MSLNPLRWHWKDWAGFEGKVHLQLQRNYVNYGKANFGFLWEFILLIGIVSNNAKAALYIGIIFYFICYFVGRYLYKHRWLEADIEAGNRYNPFIREMRDKIGLPNKRKI